MMFCCLMHSSTEFTKKGENTWYDSLKDKSRLHDIKKDFMFIVNDLFYEAHLTVYIDKFVEKWETDEPQFMEMFAQGYQRVAVYRCLGYSGMLMVNGCEPHNSLLKKVVTMKKLLHVQNFILETAFAMFGFGHAMRKPRTALDVDPSSKSHVKKNVKAMLDSAARYFWQVCSKNKWYSFRSTRDRKAVYHPASRMIDAACRACMDATDTHERVNRVNTFLEAKFKEYLVFLDGMPTTELKFDELREKTNMFYRVSETSLKEEFFESDVKWCTCPLFARQSFCPHSGVETHNDAKYAWVIPRKTIQRAQDKINQVLRYSPLPKRPVGQTYMYKHQGRRVWNAGNAGAVSGNAKTTGGPNKRLGLFGDVDSDDASDYEDDNDDGGEGRDGDDVKDLGDEDGDGDGDGELGDAGKGGDSNMSDEKGKEDEDEERRDGSEGKGKKGGSRKKVNGRVRKGRKSGCGKEGDGRPTGHPNISNTCYLNTLLSCLQCLPSWPSIVGHRNDRDDGETVVDRCLHFLWVDRYEEPSKKRAWLRALLDALDDNPKFDLSADDGMMCIDDAFEVLADCMSPLKKALFESIFGIEVQRQNICPRGHAHHVERKPFELVDYLTPFDTVKVQNTNAKGKCCTRTYIDFDIHPSTAEPIQWRCVECLRSSKELQVEAKLYNEQGHWGEGDNTRIRDAYDRNFPGDMTVTSIKKHGGISYVRSVRTKLSTPPVISLYLKRQQGRATQRRSNKPVLLKSKTSFNGVDYHLRSFATHLRSPKHYIACGKYGSQMWSAWDDASRQDVSNIEATIKEEEENITMAFYTRITGDSGESGGDINGGGDKGSSDINDDDDDDDESDKGRGSSKEDKHSNLPSGSTVITVNESDTESSEDVNEEEIDFDAIENTQVWLDTVDLNCVFKFYDLKLDMPPSVIGIPGNLLPRKIQCWLDSVRNRKNAQGYAVVNANTYTDKGGHHWLAVAWKKIADGNILQIEIVDPASGYSVDVNTLLENTRFYSTANDCSPSMKVEINVRNIKHQIKDVFSCGYRIAHYIIATSKSMHSQEERKEQIVCELPMEDGFVCTVSLLCAVFNKVYNSLIARKKAKIWQALQEKIRNTLCLHGFPCKDHNALRVAIKQVTIFTY